jgi:hypothetical protein
MVSWIFFSQACTHESVNPILCKHARAKDVLTKDISAQVRAS